MSTQQPKTQPVLASKVAIRSLTWLATAVNFVPGVQGSRHTFGYTYASTCNPKCGDSTGPAPLSAEIHNRNVDEVKVKVCLWQSY